MPENQSLLKFETSLGKWSKRSDHKWTDDKVQEKKGYETLADMLAHGPDIQTNFMNVIRQPTNQPITLITEVKVKLG